MSIFGKILKRFIENVESNPERSERLREFEITELMKRLPTGCIYDFQMALAIEVLRRLAEAQNASGELRAAAKKVLGVDDQ